MIGDTKILNKITAKWGFSSLLNEWQRFVLNRPVIYAHGLFYYLGPTVVRPGFSLLLDYVTLAVFFSEQQSERNMQISYCGGGGSVKVAVIVRWFCGYFVEVSWSLPD